MIPIKADEATFEQYVTNIITTYARASVEQKLSGERWYVTANQLADLMSEGHTRQAAGVIAALSANKSWTENVRLSRGAYASGKAQGHVKDAIRKATRIMNGEDPEQVLPMDSKTGQFFLCIDNPEHPTAVCIDRHAHDVAVGETYGNQDRGLGAKGRYRLIADAYREAARRLNTLPMVVQAVSWVVQVEHNSQWNARKTSPGEADR